RRQRTAQLDVIRRDVVRAEVHAGELRLTEVVIDQHERRSSARRNDAALRIDGHAQGLDWCLAHARATVVASIVVFALSALIALTRGGEFMPKLDEGALWVRATMPYTISFEESSA